MNDGQNRTVKRRGFTILELLVVVAIMAVIATLAIGAAIQSVRQVRKRRVEAMCKTLEMALANYRAQENQWPFSPAALVRDPRDRNILWAHGINNLEVFRKMYQGAGGSSSTMVYLDASALMTSVSGSRMPLRTALELRKTEAPLGYPLPSDPDRFCFYCVCFNPVTDTVKVYRQDEEHPPLMDGGNGLWCPEWNKTR